MLRFGPNGIPLSCKGRTWYDALNDISNLGLNAMEVQLIRSLRNYDDEDLVEERARVKERAEELDIMLSVHAPYYMDFLGNKAHVERSLEYLRKSGVIAHELGAKTVVTHVGFYNPKSKEDPIEVAVKHLRKVRDWYTDRKYNINLAIEISGKQSLFGSLEEVIAINKRIKRTIPAVNIAHLHAREIGRFKKKIDFEELFEPFLEMKLPYLYTYFSGVEHDFEGNEIRYTPIKKGDLKFDPYAELLLDHEKKDFVIISCSPLLEHDAQYMKVIMERIRERKQAKEERAKKKEAEKKVAEKAKPEKPKADKKKPEKGKAEKAKAASKKSDKAKPKADKKKADKPKTDKKKADKAKSSKASSTKKSSGKTDKKKTDKAKSTKASTTKKSSGTSNKKSSSKASSTKKKDDKKKDDTKKKSTGKSSSTTKKSSSKSEKKSSSKTSSTKKKDDKKKSSKSSSSKKKSSSKTSSKKKK